MNLQITGLKVDAGEGSRGGRVIGHTTSGKPIYMNHGHSGHKNFNAKEHEEAAQKHLSESMKHTGTRHKTKSTEHLNESIKHHKSSVRQRSREHWRV